jgi:hypothetical protein
MRRLSISLLNEIENNGNQWRNWWPDRGCLGNLVPDICLDVSRIVPRMCPNLYLLMTLCRQLPSSGHSGVRFHWSMSLS